MISSSTMESPNLHCRFYFFGVLAGLEGLAQMVPEARSQLGENRFKIGFRTCSGLRSVLSFGGGGCVFHGESTLPVEIELLFFTERQAIKLFEKRIFMPPFPRRGIARWKQIRTFVKLALLMKKHLVPSLMGNGNSRFQETQVNLLLRIALAALCHLGIHDSRLRRLIGEGPGGLACFQVAGTDLRTWLKVDPQALHWGWGDPPETVDVTIAFRDPAIAIDALNDNLDAPAEVGRGNIRVEGRIPLAEHIEHLFTYINQYRNPS